MSTLLNICGTLGLASSSANRRSFGLDRPSCDRDLSTLDSTRVIDLDRRESVVADDVSAEPSAFRADAAVSETGGAKRAEISRSMLSSNRLISKKLAQSFRGILERVGLIRRKEYRLLREIPTGLANGNFFLIYQPKLCLRSGVINGLEALIRWEHPVLQSISPSDFIPLAERAGELRELSLWALRRAIDDQRRLLEIGHTLSIHVNISGGLLTDAAFVEAASTLVGSAAGVIGFEITETALIEDPVVALAHLNCFVEHGIVISIDDYGSGMSSLAYLKRLPARELKIDKMFISGMTSSHRDPLIIRSTIDLAHALGMVVVAEGVESLAALALLRAMGCDVAQGFLISAGLPFDRLEVFLANFVQAQLGSLALGTITPPASFWHRNSLL